MDKQSAHVQCAAPGGRPEAAVEPRPPLVPLVSAAGTDPDSAIADLADLYAGRCWHSTRLDDDYWYRYVAIGDAEMSIRRWQLHGYLRGDAAVDGEVVVQWTDTGHGRIAVGQNEKQLEPGIPTLLPIEQRFEMEYQDADQRLVHISRALVLDVASEQYLTTGVVAFDREVPPLPGAVITWRQAVANAVSTLRNAGASSMAWHEAKRDVARCLLDLYRFHAEPRPEGFDAPKNLRVRAAVEYIHAHAANPLIVADIAAAAGLSVRALQESFQRVLGTTPMVYLREVRLQRTREALQSADATETSVAAIARRWGFTHMGRFAGEYRQRFAETPRHTLISR